MWYLIKSKGEQGVCVQGRREGKKMSLFRTFRSLCKHLAHALRTLLWFHSVCRTQVSSAFFLQIPCRLSSWLIPCLCSSNPLLQKRLRVGHRSTESINRSIVIRNHTLIDRDPYYIIDDSIDRSIIVRYQGAYSVVDNSLSDARRSVR